MSSFKMKKSSFEIAIHGHDGIGKLPVNGLVAFPFGIESRSTAVTHIPTGMSILTCSTVRCCRKYIELMLERKNEWPKSAETKELADIDIDSDEWAIFFDIHKDVRDAVKSLYPTDIR